MTFEGVPFLSGLRVAIVVSRFNDFVTEPLLTGACAELTAAGVDPAHVDVVRVPGAFEIPAAARQVARTRRPSAVICLGCLIRGATPHFDYIASAASHGITAASAETGVPMAFGVLTTNSVEEAVERAGEGPDNKGREAARAALEMASLFARLEAR